MNRRPIHPLSTLRRPHPLPAAFTLIELMISIALVLLLILGINAVFKYTTTAVGQGQAINAATRDSRAAQAVFSSDFAAMVPTGPNANDAASIIIRSVAQPAFRDRLDETSDKDARPLTIDLDGLDSDGDGDIEGDTTVPGEIISPATYNFRNHRLDVLSFFARNLFPRQTGNTGVYAASMASQEAWIWYGHLWLPTNDPTTPVKQYPIDTTKGPSTFPGAGGSFSANPNNYYATQFVLGRVATLLTEKQAGGNIYLNPVALTGRQRFIDNTAGNLSPLMATSVVSPSNADDSTDYSAYNFSDSRFDLAAGSIRSYLAKLSADCSNAANLSNTPWWDQMMSGNPIPAPTLTPPGANLVATRFKCNPFITKPIDSTKMAQASPYFMAGCTQFIVEFAGDFVQQDDNPASATYGQVLDITTTSTATPDGLDYELIPAPTPTPRSQWQRKIRWYGLPRNTSGGAAIPGNSGATYTASSKTFTTGSLSDNAGSAPFPPTDSTSLTQTCPLRDVIAASPNAVTHLQNLLSAKTTNAWIERDIPAAVANYAATPTGGMASGSDYAVAWGPDSTAMGIPAPSLIRITVTLTDSSGRLPDGLTYEYVFAVPAP